MLEVEVKCTVSSLCTRAMLRSSSFSFREQLGRVIESGAERVAIDLSEVTLIDSAGLSVLAGVARRFILVPEYLPLQDQRPDAAPEQEHERRDGQRGGCDGKPPPP